MPARTKIYQRRHSEGLGIWAGAAGHLTPSPSEEPLQGVSRSIDNQTKKKDDTEQEVLGVRHLPLGHTREKSRCKQCGASVKRRHASIHQDSEEPMQPNDTASANIVGDQVSATIIASRVVYRDIY